MSQINEQTADYQLADLSPVIKAADAGNTLLESLPIWLSAQTRKSAGRGRSASNTLQYGVQKLRGLILELAVRGKLVPQDQNDESASIFLEKIVEEKERLIKEGKIKKQKPLPQIHVDEMPFHLPSGWIWSRLGDLAVPQAGFAFKSNMFNETGDGLPLIRIRDVGQSFSGTYYSGEYRDEFLVKKGDYLISMDGTFRVAKSDLNLSLLNQRVSRLNFHSQLINKEFVATSLQLRLLELQGIKAYTTVDHLSGGQINNAVVGIPPLAEQHRIVKKVEELMALCDQLEQQQADAVQAHDTLVKVLLDTLTRTETAEDFQQNWRRIAEHFDTLFTTESSIDQLKQTLLQLAVMGKLVPQDPNDESANVLLEKIAGEKARLVKEGKIKKQKPLPEIHDDEKPFLHPQNWSWARFGDVFTLEYGNNLPQPKRTNTGEYPVYGSNGIVGTHDNYSIKDPCIVIGRKGSAGALNLCKHEGCWVTDVAYSSVAPKGIDQDFAFKLFHTLGLDNLGKGIKPGLNRNEAYIIPIALPPLAEQQRIVKKVDELMALCDQLKDRLNHAQTLQQQLADAVVETTI